MLDKETEKIASSVSYLIPERYITGRITEYDIRQANVNMLLKYGKIDMPMYEIITNMPKMDREVYVGKWIKADPTIGKTISQGIVESKLQLFDANNISLPEVIRIASDAVYVNRFVPLAITKFDNVEFVEKRVYNSFVNLKGVLFFIKYIDNSIDIDIKGLGSNQIFHQDYMISIIANIIYRMETSSAKDAIKELNLFIEDYVSLKLPKEYYREMNPFSKYRVKGRFLLDFINEIDPSIDINYNLLILRELMSILYENYQATYKRG